MAAVVKRTLYCCRARDEESIGMEQYIDVPRAYGLGTADRLARPYWTTETAPSVDAYDGTGEKRGTPEEVTQQ